MPRRLTHLSTLRDNIRARESELRELRAERDKLVIWLADHGVSERIIGVHAGIAGPYVNQLKKRHPRKKVTR